MKILLLGAGKVGLSLLEMLPEVRYSRGGSGIQVSAIADSGGYLHTQGMKPLEIAASKRSGKLHSLHGWKEGGRLLDVIAESDADVLVDCMTTNFRDAKPSLDCVLAAFRKGMDVVTANKGPLALHAPLVLGEARRAGSSIMFSATVGGGTPFIDFGMLCRRDSSIASLRGILNGTTNFVLTRMSEGLPADSAITEAKAAGIAETDPTNDIRGLDSSAKIVILANTLAGREYTLPDVDMTGIEAVTPEMFREAESSGRSLKLISTYIPGEEVLRVSPELVSSSDHLNVGGTYNALTYTLEDGNEFTLIGTGAGAVETARAVARDIASLLDAREGKRDNQARTS